MKVLLDSFIWMVYCKLAFSASGKLFHGDLRLWDQNTYSHDLHWKTNFEQSEEKIEATQPVFSISSKDGLI